MQGADLVDDDIDVQNRDENVERSEREALLHRNVLAERIMSFRGKYVQ